MIPSGHCASAHLARGPASKSETLCARRTPRGPRPEVTAVTSSPPLPGTGFRAPLGSLCFPRAHRLRGPGPLRIWDAEPGWGGGLGRGSVQSPASPPRGSACPLAPPAGRPSPPSIPAGEEEETWRGAAHPALSHSLPQVSPPEPARRDLQRQHDGPHRTQPPPHHPTPPSAPPPERVLHREHPQETDPLLFNP